MNAPPATPRSELSSSTIEDNSQSLTRFYTGLILVTLPGLGAGVVLELSMNHVSTAILAGLGLLSVLAALRLVRRRRFEMAAIILAVILIGLITIVSTHRYGIRDISVLALPAVLSAASLVTRRRNMLYVLLFSLACVAWLTIGEFYAAYRPAASTGSSPGEFLIAAGILAATAFTINLPASTLLRNNLRLQTELEERRRAEEALQENRALLQAVIESLPFEVWVCGRNGQYVVQNATHLAHWGPVTRKTVEEIEGLPEDIVELWHQENRRAFAGETVRRETERSLAGETRYFDSMVAPVHVGKEIRWVAGINIDITERRRMRQELDENRRRLAFLLAKSPTVVYSSRAAGDFGATFMSANVTRQLGYQPAEFVDDPAFWMDNIHPDDAGRVLSGIQKLFEQGVHTHEYRFRHKDGRYLWMRDELTLIRDEAGAPREIIGSWMDITESKLAAEALARSEERFEQVTDCAGVWVWEVDAQGMYTYVSPSEETILGYRAEEVVGKKHFYDFFAPEAKAELTETSLRLFSQKLPFRNLENSNLHRDGRIVFLETSGIPMLDEEGRLVGYRGADRDISARKEAERARRESLLRQSAILANIPDLAWLKDEASRFIAVNQPMARACGSTPEDLVGKSDLDVWPEELALAYRRDDLEVMRTGKRKDIEERLVDSTGQETWIESIKTPIFNDAGRVIGTAGIARDITARKRTEAALRLSEEKFAKAFRDSPDIIVLTSLEDGRIVEVNDSLGRLAGYSHEEVLGKTTAELSFWADPADREQYTKMLRQDGRVHNLEVDFRIKSGELRHALLSGEIIELTDRKYILGVIRDITERKQVEKALRENEIIFSSFLEHSPVYVFFKDKEIRSLRLSKNYEQMLGLPLSKALGKSMEELFPSELARAMVADDRRILAEGKVVKAVEELNGRTYETTKFPIIIDGAPGLLAGFTLDITERKQAEDALRLSESRYRTLAQNLPDSALLLFDRDLRCVLADGPELDAAGFTREALEGTTLPEVLPAVVAELLEPGVQQALQGEKSSSEIPYQDRYYRCSYVPLRDGSGEITLAMALATNITPLKQTEEALRDSQRRLSNAMRATRVGVWEWDLRTNQAYWSDENYRLLGLQPGEVESRYETWARSLHPDDLPAAEARLTEAVSGGGSLNIEFRVIWPDGSLHWVNDIGDLLIDEETGQPLGMYGIQMDVTERKRLEEERERLIRELEARNAESEILRESAAAVAFPLEFEETASRILEQLQRAVPYDSASVHLMVGNELEIIGGRGFPEGKNPIGMRFALDETDPAYPILRDSLPYVLFPDIQLVSERFREFFHQHIHSWMAIPLHARSRLIGMLAIDGFTVNQFTEAHARFALTFANQVAVTLENSRLYAELQMELKKQIALRSAITAISSSLNLNDVLSEICLQMASGIEATSAYIANYDPTGSSLRVVAEYLSANVSQFERVSDLGETYYRQEGAWLFDDRQQISPRTLHIDDPDLTAWASNYLRMYGGKSILYLPLYIQGRLIGHAELWETRRKRLFTEDEISFCQAIAQQAAIAIENAGLFEQLQEEKERAEVTLHSIGDAVITADIDARVEYLNPIAENLTGWTLEEAAGQPLVEVFRIIEEGSRQPAVSPVERCLHEGRVVGLANHSILIGRDGREFAIDDSAAPIRNRKGDMIGVVLVFHDVTEERRLSQQIAHDAIHDTLTGLVNRREFDRRLERALISTKEHNISHVLCYLDLDQFKIVNDTAGHAAGDELLRQISGLLSGLFRQRDTLARLGGDEFGLLLENCQLDRALVIANEIRAKIRDYPFVWAGHGFHVGVSIGVVPITGEKESISQLLSQADVACYSAKDLGRDRVYVYQAEDGEPTQQHREILQAARMRDAIFQNRFRLFCQPIVQVAGGLPGRVQYEVLLRMADSGGHLVLPSAFIPSAERFGLMHTIDQWVIRETLFTLSKHDIEHMLININISGNSLDDETLSRYVLEQLEEFSISPEHICFEITETAAIHHLSKAQQFIHTFKQRGGRIALDDFGSGFSSFRYLKTLSVDYIKIDGGFVSDMLSNPGDLLMVEAITRIAHTLGIQVIAEHASNAETIDRLREIGVDCVQGFGIGLPLPVQEAWRSRRSRE